MATLTTRDPSLPPVYSDTLDALSLAPLWTALHALLPNERATRALPHVWPWRAVRPRLLDAARLVPMEQAERRVLVLRNPGLAGSYAITSTLFAGFQILLPNETAPSHHHTPAALRLVVEGQGAYTTVEGVRCPMEVGDLIITPPMRWHDHGHQGAEPVIWLDGLDIPLVRSLDAAWASKMRPAQPPVTATDPSADEFTAAGLVPRASHYPPTGFPQMRWPWRTVRPALERLAATAPADAPVTLRYVDPTTGRAMLPTMGAEAQWLRPGERTRGDRRTTSRIFHVIEGQGQSRVGEHVLAWERGDTFVAPPWHWLEHEQRGDGPACLFQFNDEPVLQALGLWRDEQR